MEIIAALFFGSVGGLIIAVTSLAIIEVVTNLIKEDRLEKQLLNDSEELSIWVERTERARLGISLPVVQN